MDAGAQPITSVIPDHFDYGQLDPETRATGEGHRDEIRRREQRAAEDIEDARLAAAPPDPAEPSPPEEAPMDKTPLSGGDPLGSSVTYETLRRSLRAIADELAPLTLGIEDLQTQGKQLVAVVGSILDRLDALEQRLDGLEAADPAKPTV